MPLRARLPSLSALAALLAGPLLAPGPAHAGSPFLEVPAPDVAEASPAYRYANLSNEEALAELERRNIPHRRVESAPGVRAPVRLTGRLHGVHFHSSLPPEAREGSVFEILDARLALALDDFAALLEEHDVDEVVHFTMYRPNAAPPKASKADPAKRGESARLSDAAKREPDEAARGERGPASAKEAAGDASAEAPSAEKVADPPGRAPTKRPAEPENRAEESAPKGTGEPDRAPGSLDEVSAPPSPEFPATAPRSKLRPRAAPALRPKSKAPPRGETGAKKNAKKSHAAKAPPKKAGPKTRVAKARSDKSAPGKRGSAARAEKPRGKRARVAAPGKHRRPPARQAPKWAPPGTRHPAGLAIDVGGLRKKDGRMLSVGWHFQGKRGERTCGAGARVPESESARELRAIMCEARARGIFHYVLSPNFDAAHADHFHMEIKPGVRWFLYH